MDDTKEISKILLESLIRSPLLIGDLPEAQSFDRKRLNFPSDFPELDLEQKLGHLYEDALAYLLATSEHFQLLEKSLQLQKDMHTTLGELDFLLRDCRSNGLIHLELATKFYLAVKRKEGMDLPGPNARDNYWKKLKRLRGHQVQLSKKHQDYLPEHYKRSDIETRQLIYGCLFDRIDATTKAKPEFLNENCRRGYWLYEHEVKSFFPTYVKFDIIPKCLWPAPLNLLEGLNLEEWTKRKPLKRCLMVRVEGEVQPYFVAPSGYPGGAL